MCILYLACESAVLMTLTDLFQYMIILLLVFIIQFSVSCASLTLNKDQQVRNAFLILSKSTSDLPVVTVNVSNAWTWNVCESAESDFCWSGQTTAHEQHAVLLQLNCYLASLCTLQLISNIPQLQIWMYLLQLLHCTLSENVGVETTSKTMWFLPHVLLLRIG